MQTIPTHRMSAIRFWEWRRPIYNLALIVPALAGFGIVTALPAGVGDMPRLQSLDIASLFLKSAVAANVCYSFVYVLEFLVGRKEQNSWWMRSGRNVVFLAGTALSMVLALMVGGAIGIVEYP